MMHSLQLSINSPSL